VSFHAHNQVDGELKTLMKKKINNKNITAATGSGIEQAQGPHL
jgi:hypothetical protein